MAFPKPASTQDQSLAKLGRRGIDWLDVLGRVRPDHRIVLPASPWSIRSWVQSCGIPSVTIFSKTSGSLAKTDRGPASGGRSR